MDNVLKYNVKTKEVNETQEEITRYPEPEPPLPSDKERIEALEQAVLEMVLGGM